VYYAVGASLYPKMMYLKMDCKGWEIDMHKAGPGKKLERSIYYVKWTYTIMGLGHVSTRCFC
jgi:hypothetical protein